LKDIPDLWVSVDYRGYKVHPDPRDLSVHKESTDSLDLWVWMEKRANPVLKAIKATREIPERRVNRDLPEKEANEESEESPGKGVQRAPLVHRVHRAPKAQKVA
jgi:hypothetical protein